MKDRTVPASTKVRTSRIKNIDTDRLRRRLDYLHEHKVEFARNVDGRMRLRMYAREILVIERELEERCVSE